MNSNRTPTTDTRSGTRWVDRFFGFGLLPLLLVSETVDAQNARPETGKVTIQFGFHEEVYQDVDPKDARIAIGMWIEEIMSMIGDEFQAQTKTYTSLESIEKALKAGEIDMASMHTVHYLSLKNHVALDPTFVGRNGPHYGEIYVVLTRRDAGVHSLAELENSRFIYQGYESMYNIALMWLANRLHDEGLPRIGSFFASRLSVSNPSKAILPVFFGESDVCMISKKSYDLMAELNPQLKAELVVIEESPVFLQNIACFRHGMDPEVKNKILNAILKYKDEPRIKQILLFFKVDDFDDFHPENLKNVLELYEAHIKMRSEQRVHTTTPAKNVSMNETR